MGGEYWDAERVRWGEVVATGGVKDFGDGEVESYAAWSGNVSGTQWAAGKEESEGNRSGASLQGGENDEKGVEQGTREKEHGIKKYEVTAFGVSPAHQGMGLGARVRSRVIFSYDSIAFDDVHVRKMQKQGNF